MIIFSKGEFEYPIRFLEENHFPLKNQLNGDDFNSVQYLCSGTTSLIFTARTRNYNEEVVVKMLKDNLPRNNLADEEMATEIAILRRIRHPNIVEFKGAGKSIRKFLTVEYLQGGTLDHFLSSHISRCHQLVPLSRVISISRDIASALKYLHDDFHVEASVIHRGNNMIILLLIMLSILIF